MNDEDRLIWGKYLSAVATSRRMELEALDELLNEMGKPILEAEKAERTTQSEIDSLKRTEQSSSKGTYFLVTKAENPNNSAFDRLQKCISENGGFVNLYGKKFWTFSQDPTNKIGYK